MSLPAFSIRRPVFVAMIYLAFIILGLISLLRLPVELYQGQSAGVVSVIVRARGGLPPPEVEKHITKPVEEAVGTVSRLTSLVSSSKEAESRVTMMFETGTDMKFAALEVREKFSRVLPLLPREIEKPVIANYSEGESAIMIFALTSKTLSPEEVRQKVDEELKPILARIDGVASVEVYGGRERKILVELDRDKMVAYNVSVERVMDMIGRSNINLLAGNVDKDTYEFAVRSMGAFEKVEEIGEIGIQATRQGSIIPLKEIATVKDAFMEPEDAARLNLEQNVTVYIKKSGMAKAIPVARALRALLDDFEHAQEGSMDVILLGDQAQSIERAIKDVRESLLLGVLLTVLTIYIALRKWILALIVSTAIPCSVIITFFCMDMLGISINVMSLSGLALAIGIMVDSAVVVLENTFVKKEAGYSDERAILEGATEVWLPLLTSLITTLIVFLPILFIDKKIQIQYSGFAFTVSAALIISFFASVMLIPMLLMQWARGRIATSKVGAEHKPSKLKHFYSQLMRWNMMFRYPVVAGMFFMLFVASVRIMTRDIDWPSTLQENEFGITVFPLAGARLEANDEVIRKIEDMLSKIPDVELFNSTVRKDTVSVFIKLKPKEERIYSKEEIMKIVDEKGNEMVKETHDDYSLIVDGGAGGNAEGGKKFVVNIYGYENDELEKLAHEVAQRMGKVPGIQNIVMTDLRKRPEYALVVDKGRAALYGLTVQDVADSLHAQVRGMRPTKFHEVASGGEIEVITRLQAIYRQKIEDLKFLHIATDMGDQIQLGEIANFYPTVGPQGIDREDKHRYVYVRGDAKRALEAIGREMRAALKGMKMPDDYYWRFGGGYEELVEGKSEMQAALGLTIGLVYMTLACMFQSYLQPFIIMLSVPMASIGIWLSLELTKKPLSQPVFIGMVLLAGYVVNAGIILVDHMNHLRKKGLSLREALLEAGTDRLRPILMTTISTTCGFIPMAISSGESSELWSPLAVTVIGGLLSSTILTLFVLPNILLIAEEWRLIIAWAIRMARQAYTFLAGRGAGLVPPQN